MNRRDFRFALALLIPVLAHAADLPPGEDLVKRFIQNSGGAAAYARITNAEMTGTVEIQGRNITGTISTIDAGQKSWTAMELAGVGRIEQGFDGETGWETSALQGPRILEGDERNALKRGSTLAFATSWRDEYKSVRTLGEEVVDGKPAWKVELTPKEGAPETYFFDKTSGLLVRMAATVSTPLGDIATSVTVSDYRSIDGIQTAFSMTQSAMGQTILMRFSKVAYNVPVPKNRFDLPDAIKALKAKQH